MADFVTIANLAAASIGEDDQLRSPDDDTHLARSVRAVWDLERRAALRDHQWNFAIRRAQLPALADAPLDWRAAFHLPADCVRLIEVLGVSRTRYQLEGRALLADAPGPLGVRYVADVRETALWDDLFVRAFAARLGYAIADRVTGDRARRADAWGAYQQALAEAKRVDALENPGVSWAPCGWELARTGGSYGGGGATALTRDGLLFP
ncbi:hypothetical protein [Sphingomonas sp. BK235]|uniref:hypothetical protein n=1 Tax=Sphingomonas sp. BK235 TaxID=2512131 RepID=UPI00104A367F|nr:hypothetical protein [Sphingomonas sp. BK235]TCP35913.1 hypothetical protein EV292_102503 [Sphingomonas sp. BK235]